MNKSIKYLLIFSFILSARFTFAENRATIRSSRGFFEKTDQKIPGYQSRPNESSVNAVLFSPLSPNQISRPQSNRHVQFAKELFVSLYRFRSEINPVADNFQYRNDGYARMRQRLLFPFHVFW